MRGTAGYRPPEFRHNGDEGKAKYSGKVDVWALGCTLYHLVVLKPAFPFSNSLETYCTSGATLPVDIVSTSPCPAFLKASLRGILEDLLTINPRTRPSADYIARAATAWSEFLSIALVDEIMMARMEKARRHPSYQDWKKLMTEEPEKSFPDRMAALYETLGDGTTARIINHTFLVAQAKRQYNSLIDAGANSSALSLPAMVAQCYMERKDYHEAVKQYETALVEQPETFDHWDKLYQVLLAKGRPASAMARCVKLAKKHSGSSGDLKLFQLYASIGAYQSSMDSFLAYCKKKLYDNQDGPSKFSGGSDVARVFQTSFRQSKGISWDYSESLERRYAESTNSELTADHDMS
jgi:tetratricopeptide (TPR) repeat protein